jgi:Uma2 family endonuclease
MARKTQLPPDWTVGDMLEQLGNISPRRIRMNPPPGTATEKDVTAIEQRENRLFELVDGVLVEKIMGVPESHLAVRLGGRLEAVAEEHDLGFVTGADGALRLMPGLIRIPDVSFVSWERVSDRVVPSKPIPDLAPDLAVEVLSKGNTPEEMERKLKEYFLVDVRLVWFVDPRQRIVEVYSAPDVSTVVREHQTLDGGEVLPGFALPLKQLFARISREPAPRKRGNGKRQNRRK